MILNDNVVIKDAIGNQKDHKGDDQITEQRRTQIRVNVRGNILVQNTDTLCYNIACVLFLFWIVCLFLLFC